MPLLNVHIPSRFSIDCRLGMHQVQQLASPGYEREFDYSSWKLKRHRVPFLKLVSDGDEPEEIQVALQESQAQGRAPLLLAQREAGRTLRQLLADDTPLTWAWPATVNKRNVAILVTFARHRIEWGDLASLYVPSSHDPEVTRC